MRYYLDAAPIIYLVEQVEPFASLIKTKLSTPELSLVTSELTRLECRVKPVRDNDASLLQDFDDYFVNSIEKTYPLTRSLIDRATEIRGRFGFKTPDAIHLAAAMITASDVFLTNDHRLSSFTQMTVEVV